MFPSTVSNLPRAVLSSAPAVFPSPRPAEIFAHSLSEHVTTVDPVTLSPAGRFVTSSVKYIVPSGFSTL